MMRVEICIKNAVELYGHLDDQVRPAQPMTSTVVVVSVLLTKLGFGVTGDRDNEMYLPRHPMLKTLVHHVRFQVIWTVCTIIERPKSVQ
jgi:hypothetical protein